jgi:hypothetical protein
MKGGQRAHRLSKRQQLQGLEKAIESKRTPPWLKSSMRRFARKLRDEIAAEDHSAHQNGRHSFF